MYRIHYLCYTLNFPEEMIDEFIINDLLNG